MPRKKFHELSHHLQDVMEESLPKMVDTRVKELTKTQMRFIKNARIFGQRFLRKLTILSLTIFLLRLIHLSGHILHVHLTQASPASAEEQQYQFYLTMKDNPQLQQDDFPIWLALKYMFERLHVYDTSCRPSAVPPRDQDDPHDDAHPEGENSAKRQKTFEHGTYVFRESSSGQDNESEPGPSTSGNQEQLDDFDFWTDSYAIDDDELPTEKVSQELVEEMS
ncbi:hypothetical protein Tco_1116700 [Tanacetum coccineum]